MGTGYFQCVINIEEMRLLGFHENFLPTWRISLASSRDWRINLASPLPPPIRSDNIPGRRLSPTSRKTVMPAIVATSCWGGSFLFLERKNILSVDIDSIVTRLVFSIDEPPSTKKIILLFLYYFCHIIWTCFRVAGFVAEAEVGGIELAISATATCHCSAVEVFNCVVPIVGQGVFEKY
jgi:hypothetical protein